jgi:hypothetical protein
MKRALLTLLFSGLAFSALAQDTPQTNLPRIKLQAGMYQIDTQVAQTPDQRRRHHREFGRHEATNHRLALLRKACAFCAGNEPRLVCEEGAESG